MRVLRTGLSGFLIMAALGVNVGVQGNGPIIGLAREAIAEPQSDAAASRFGRWTRARLQAAKKHWAEHERWFSEFNRELEGLKKSVKRMAYDRQAHFLEDCIRRKH